MTTPTESELIHDWNVADGAPETGRPHVELNDETLRDGLQSPSVRTPSIESKLEVLHLLSDIGIDALDIGLPGAGPHVQRDVLRLAQEIVSAKLPIVPNCAARTLEADIRPIAEISQRAGIAIEAACFLGSSPIRQYAEGWTLDRLLELVRSAVGFAVGEGLPVMFVTEDTTRARPADLRALYTRAIEAGARRICIADTVGHATPAGTRALVAYLRQVVDATGVQVVIDWHGHNDRGLGVANSIAAAEAGADRIHGTVLGIGERVGNCALDQLLVNFELLGWSRRNLAPLPRACELVSRATGVPVPDQYPVIGRDAFRTQTGVHAAAILKARAKGDDWLADRIYSGIPASLVGRHQEVELGPMSGQANVVYWLQARDIAADPELVQALFERCKAASATLEEADILAVCRERGAV
ncbi:MAG: 2-isopropylmalate synthase [Thermoanaerobaculia bacterium]|nr:MAG: 2-isopropylmalate synthase [Thermoanaerobaculia bacterium]MBZ0103617.1 LeuA family protein [Thermoanaerobaculia bacterium]